MASTITKPAKQLGELLQQQQEPFVLDLYLVDRGYLKKGLNLNSEAGFGCCNGNSNKVSKKGIPRCSRILRALVNKFTHSTKSRNTKSCGGKFSDNNGQVVAEPDWFSSASSTTVFNLCSESDKARSPTNSLRENHESVVAANTLEALRFSYVTEKEVYVGGEFQCQFTANNKQHSPLSVLEQLPSSQLKVRTRQNQEDIEMTCTVILPNKLVSTEDLSSMFSASLCELHFHSDSQKPIRNGIGVTDDIPILELIKSNNTSSKFLKSKRMLQQTRQLLFDCVREIVESQVKKEKVKTCEGLLGPEELGNLVWEKMKAWGKQVGDETNNITYLLGLDFFDSAQEWFGFDQEKGEICSEIGDSLAEEIVNDFVIELSN